MEENAVNLQDDVVDNVGANLDKQETEIEAEAPEVEQEAEPELSGEEKEVFLDDLPVPGDDTEKKKDLPKWAEKRISKKEKELAQKEAEAAMYKAELERVRSGTSVSDEQYFLNAPKREDYATEDEFLDARDEYRDKKKELKYQTENHQRQMIAAELEFRKKWNAAHDEGMKKYEDFEDKTELLNSHAFPSNRAMAEAIASSDINSDVLYFLGTYPDHAKKIALMNPIDAVKEITKIELKIRQTKKPNITKAPPVVKPVNSNSGGVTQSDPNNMSADNFRKWYDSTYKRA